MKLPKFDPEQCYDGLYVVDFGPTGEGNDDTVGVGYTAEEVAMLLESERYRDVRVYKVHRVLPDGTVELRGMSRRRFESESAFVFCSRDKDVARKGFDDLKALAERDPLPCRARLLYGGLGYQPQFPWVAAMLFPAECEDEVSRWLLDHDVRAGETVDSGISHATIVLENLQVRDHAQLASVQARKSRSRDALLKAVGETLAG
jgi:hypothetical protein